MTYDVAAVRACFPALRHGVAHFDGPGGSQVPEAVAQAVAEALCAGIANRGSVTAAERRADEIVVGARQAMGDLIGTEPGGVVFGRSMTQLTYDFSRALAKRWRPSDEVVVTRLDHDANVRPWVQAAEAVGADVRWAAVDRNTAELPVAAVTDQLSARTRLVAVTGASNLLGTRPDVAAICAAVRTQAPEALVYVDGVHLVPHAPVDVAALGADFFACSPYKFFGPHLGVLAAAPQLLETVQNDKLLPSTSDVPERFELGTLPYELLAGVTATVDFIADLALPPTVRGLDRRTRVATSMAATEEHEQQLFGRLVDGLADVPGVTLHGRPLERTPTVAFSVKDRSGSQMYEALALRGVNAPAGTFYALEPARWLGLDAGVVRAGLAPYTDDEDVDRLLSGVAELAR